ncbi:MAG: acyl-CoA desaturase [Saprospirales bacterium]|nr:acyl-CoA desaturase [Saprospirales bacterium]MBK8489481.1 acyl-CoA desaturase [Saprospirales bacterium]
MQTLPKFATQIQKDFASALNSNVNQYFQDNHISRNANLAMVLKSLFHLTGWIGSYLLLVFGHFDILINYALWALVGFFMVMVTVNIGHDAIHGSYSANKWVNSLLAHTFNLNGASAYMWKRMHNQAHHSYTNIEGLDEDIEPIPVIRLSTGKELKKIHRYQHIYAFFFYCLATLSWVFIKDYVKFFKNEVGNFTGEPNPKKEYFYLFFYKFLNYSLFLVLPIILIPHPWIHTVLGFLLMHFVAGFFLAIIFMLAHVVEETHFLNPDEGGRMPHSWTVHQLYTTANFARNNPLAAFLTGGLNQQIEHHLFPHICSIHYPAIGKIVKETAEEYGQPYYESSFTHALISHVRFLKRLGRETPAVSDN